MAKTNLGLRHSDVDTTQRSGGGHLPDGHYRFEVDEMKIKDHHDDRRGYELAAVLEVIEPEELKGRKIFIDFNVDDPDGQNPDWEVWGREALGKFLKAIDFPEDKPFDDTDDVIGMTGIAKVGLDRYRSDKANRRIQKVWAYVYPEDERDWLDKNDLGESERQEQWNPGKQTPKEDRGRSRDDRGDRGRDRDRGGSREREDRGRDRDRDNRDNDRSRGRDREDNRGRDNDRGRDNSEDRDDIPFDGNRDEGSRNEGGSDRPSRGGGSRPWANNR